MSQTYELKAEAREQVGKGSARAVRRDGKIPAVIYGDRQPPLPIALPYKDVYYKIHGGGFLTTIATIDIDGQKIRVLPKDFQLDPVRDDPCTGDAGRAVFRVRPPGAALVPLDEHEVPLVRRVGGDERRLHVGRPAMDEQQNRVPAVLAAYGDPLLDAAKDDEPEGEATAGPGQTPEESRPVRRVGFSQRNVAFTESGRKERGAAGPCQGYI